MLVSGISYNEPRSLSLAVMYIHRQSAYLIGRQRHVSCTYIYTLVFYDGFCLVIVIT